MSEANNHNQKRSFLLGLGVGVGVLAIIGFFIMIGMYLDIKNDDVAGVAAAKNQPTNNQQPSPNPSPTKAEIEVNVDDHIRGNPSWCSGPF